MKPQLHNISRNSWTTQEYQNKLLIYYIWSDRRWDKRELQEVHERHAGKRGKERWTGCTGAVPSHKDLPWVYVCHRLWDPRTAASCLVPAGQQSLSSQMTRGRFWNQGPQTVICDSSEAEKKIPRLSPLALGTSHSDSWDCKHHSNMV